MAIQLHHISGRNDKDLSLKNVSLQIVYSTKIKFNVSLYHKGGGGGGGAVQLPPNYRGFCLFDLILYVHSTIFQLCGTFLPGFNQY